MKSVTTTQMRKLDEAAMARYGIPSLILMENAGRGIAELAVDMVRRGGFETRPYILLICGKGNNGGDGMVAARHLFNRGCRVNVILLADPDELKDDPKINFDILKKMGVPVVKMETTPHPNPLPRGEGRAARGQPRQGRGKGGKRGQSQKVGTVPILESFIQNSDLIIDAIFGVGLKRPVTGLYFDVIRTINHSKRSVLSIDVPSGIDSDTGEALDIAVRASATGTLGAVKRGLLVAQGAKASGHISILDISIPRQLLKKFKNSSFL